MRCDYHTHTCHSMDGHQTIAELCESEIRAGFDEVCLTEHYEPMHPTPGADIPPKLEFLLADYRAAKKLYPRLSLRLGIEIGDNPPYHDMIARWLDEWPLDYRLMSLHLVGKLDPYDRAYFSQFDDRRELAYPAYAQAILDSLRTWNPGEYDALAHLGYCGRYAPYPDERKPLLHSDAPDIIDDILRILARDGKALEINTSRFNKTKRVIPDPSIVKRFRELGGEFIMFGSDAHRPEQVGHGFEYAYQLARGFGFQYTCRFDQRRRAVIPIPD
ncbi:MAG: histidinol-phosphatase HisJ family protein [Oscillospiraceae bacterium]|jgi:histidinol-phosphatase (PHP family)|nr:histidinol-phosphatase HisJ family protein [Oscillospiraceae bacterium]